MMSDVNELTSLTELAPELKRENLLPLRLSVMAALSLYDGAGEALRHKLDRYELSQQTRDVLGQVFRWDGPAVLSLNQVVAANLRRARQLRGWTQENAAEQLAPHIGALWSKSSFSAAERSVVTGRRLFSADELLAFARAFRVPLVFFFQPPEGVVVSERPEAHQLHPARPLDPGELAAAVGAEPSDTHPTPPVEERHVAAVNAMRRLAELDELLAILSQAIHDLDNDTEGQ